MSIIDAGSPPLDVPPVNEEGSGGGEHRVTLWLSFGRLRDLEQAMRRRDNGVTVDQVFDELLDLGMSVATLALDKRLFHRGFRLWLFRSYRRVSLVNSESLLYAAEVLNSGEVNLKRELKRLGNRSRTQRIKYLLAVRCVFYISGDTKRAIERFTCDHGYDPPAAYQHMFDLGVKADTLTLYKKIGPGQFESL